uniref:Phospholipase ABHD3 n=1 Tax=Astyanax mexicanus TaxID=7994 RepID=A0A3B1JI21_ASTMX
MLLSLLSLSELWTGCVDYISRPCTLLLSLITASLFYLWGREGQVPLLVCGDGFRVFLQRHCPVVVERFCPTPWCWGGRVQTLVRAFIKSNTDVTYRNELIRTSDGGQISLDWVDNANSATHPQRSTRPTILFLPGMTGNSQQTYILTAVQHATQLGYRCVVLNNRGFGGEELLTPLTFCAADVDTVVNHVKELYPQAPLLGAGVSLGGMLLMYYLACKGQDSKIVAGLTISVVWESFETSVSLEQPINRLLFNRHIAINLCLAVKRHRKILEKAIDVDHVLKARTIREFDERFRSPINGYKTCVDYYKDASPVYKLQQTKVPVLCLNAADDPFSPKHALPVGLVQRMPNVALLVTAHGGHIGFLEGLFPKSEGYVDRLFRQFIWAAFEHLEELREACNIKEHLTE